MDLREYLFRKRMNVSYFAKVINYDRSSISRIVHGKKPGRKLAAIIEKATDGKVTAKELLNPVKEDDRDL